MTASKILFYFCLSFVSGIFISSLLGFLPGSREILLLPGLILGASLIFIPLFLKKTGLIIVGFCLIFLVFGIWRHQIAEFEILANELKKYNDLGREITLIGIISEEPDTRENHTKLTIKVENIENNPRIIEGKILVTTRKYPEYQYGDKLKIQGKLETPEIFEDFNYRDYLVKDGIYSVMYFPKIGLIGRNCGNFVMKILFSFKNKLKESLNNVMPRPQSAILEALFFGEEGNISKEWKEKFNLTSTRHVTAVSGMNITIVAVLLLNFILMLGLWRQQAFYFSIFLITLYILMIGAPSSAVRAGIMAILFLTAQHFGRLSAASRAVVMAATLILIQNSLLLKLDIGFQLSFLAMMGLVYLQPIFLNLFKKIPNVLQLRNNLAATLSAQIFTFPILIYNFGQISLISPLVNILILPLIPLITILGFVFSLIGIFWQNLGQILSWPIWLLITYILKVIDFFSKISWAFLTFQNVHWIFVLVSYLILGIIVRRLQERQKLKFLKY